jgi:cytosine/uracil/thiamine/allantoin permease
MNTINILGPIVALMCVEGYLNNRGFVCVREVSTHNRIQYYKPGFSCYVNGIFYTDCKNAPKPIY